MKKILILFFFVSICNAQTAIYNKIKTQDNFTVYQTKSGNTIKIGDTLHIRYPRAGNQYSFIWQDNEPSATNIANTKIIVSQIKTIGSDKRGYKTYILHKEYDTYPFYIDYESALETGEIKNPFE
jgi:hypothetical protein